jgi:hypothetical protein
MDAKKDTGRNGKEPKAPAPAMSSRVTVIKTDPHLLEEDFMYAFAEDPNESEISPAHRAMALGTSASSGQAFSSAPTRVEYNSSYSVRHSSGPSIRGPPGAMRTAQSVLSHLGRPMGLGRAPVVPPGVAVSSTVSSDDSLHVFSYDPAPGSHPGGSATDPSTKAALEHAMTSARGASAAHDFDQDDLSIPNWFSLMQSGLDYHEGSEVYTGPCLGLVVSNADVSSALGSETFDPDTESFFVTAPLVSISQSASSLGALYTYKPDSEKRITEYARFLTSPLIPIAAGTLYAKPGLDLPEGTVSVSCEGKVVLRLEDLLKALAHYETHGASMRAITDIIRVKYPPGHAFSLRCLMRVPAGFWKGDTIMHTIAKVCICTRAPVPLPAPGHVMTPGYRETLFQKWNTLA